MSDGDYLAIADTLLKVILLVLTSRDFRYFQFKSIDLIKR